jgi:hypothetical protein
MSCQNLAMQDAGILRTLFVASALALGGCSGPSYQPVAPSEAPDRLSSETRTTLLDILDDPVLVIALGSLDHADPDVACVRAVVRELRTEGPVELGCLELDAGHAASRTVEGAINRDVLRLFMDAANEAVEDRR